jgi:putative DNA primase/helicase
MMASEPLTLQERLRRIDGALPNDAKRRRRDPDDAKAAQETEANSSAATQLTELLLMAKSELWHTPDREPFATFTTPAGVVSHAPIYSSDFAEYAQRLYYLKTGNAIASDAVRAAVNTVAADAKFAGVEHDVYSRVAHFEDEVWIDLGDDTWEAVRIDHHGWAFVESAGVPVKFRRTRSSRPLPRPKTGGSLEEIRALFRMEDEDWQALLGWMLGVFQSDGARAHLELIGQQGSGKSTLARCLVAMTDPVSIPGRSLSKDEEALIIAVQGRAVLAFDNVSVVMPDMQDALCRLSTGGGLGKRKLHSDQEEVLIRAQLPILWTSIVPITAARPDLQDRTITVRLDALSDTEYRSEREIDLQFQSILPGLTGALYDLVSAALRNVKTVQLERRPRLADFAEWVEAAAPNLGWEPGAFVAVLESSRMLASAQAVDSSLVGRLIIDFMKDRPEWHGQS